MRHTYPKNIEVIIFTSTHYLCIMSTTNTEQQPNDNGRTSPLVNAVVGGDLAAADGEEEDSFAEFDVGAAAEVTVQQVQAESEDGAAAAASASAANQEDEDDEGDDDEEVNMESLLLPLQDFLTALQDPGKMDRSVPPKTQHPLLKKLGRQYFPLWKDKMPGLPKHVTRTSELVESVATTLRNSWDIGDVIPEISQFAPKNPIDLQMYIISNDKDGGQHHLVEMIKNHLQSKIVTKASNRNPSIAIRLCAALLHEDVRAGAAKYLAGKHLKDDQDQSGNTYVNWFQEVLDIFENPEFVVDRPDVVDGDDVDPDCRLDPNNCEYTGRDVKWLIDTWKNYIKGTYKKVLQKWFKETGGGNRQLDNFVNYCTIGDKTHHWLVYVYALDLRQSILLGSKTGAGRPSALVMAESGFENTDFGTGGDLEGSYETPLPGRANSGRSSAKGAKFDAVQAQMEQSAHNVQQLVGMMKSRIPDPLEQELDSIEKMNVHKRKLMDDSDYDEDEKEKLVAAIKKKKKKHLQNIMDLGNESS